MKELTDKELEQAVGGSYVVPTTAVAGAYGLAQVLGYNHGTVSSNVSATTLIQPGAIQSNSIANASSSH